MQSLSSSLYIDVFKRWRLPVENFYKIKRKFSIVLSKYPERAGFIWKKKKKEKKERNNI